MSPRATHESEEAAPAVEHAEDGPNTAQVDVLEPVSVETQSRAERARALLESGEAGALMLAADVCAHSVDTGVPPLLIACGDVALAQGDVHLAFQNFRSAFQIARGSVDAAFHFGDLALRTREYEVAKAAFEHAVALAPENYDAAIRLGTALRHLGDSNAAEEAYLRAVAIDEERGEAHLHLGLLYEDEFEDRSRAHEALLRFVEVGCHREELAAACEEVTRRCHERTERERRQGQGARCRPGRLQWLEQTSYVRPSGARAMQEEAARMQAEAERQEAEQLECERQEAEIAEIELRLEIEALEAHE